MSFRQNRFAHSSFIVGKKSSSSAGYGFPLGIKISGSTSSRACAVYADDAGAALAAGSYAGFESRTLLTTAISAADVSVYGVEGHLRNVVTDGTRTNGNIAGLWGYNETSGSGLTIGSIGGADNLWAGVSAQVDVPTGNTLRNGGYIAAYGVGYSDLGATHTGKATVLQVVNPKAGVWDYFAVFSNATGAAIAASSVTTVGAVLKIYVTGIGALYIPAYTTES